MSNEPPGVTVFRPAGLSRFLRRFEASAAGLEVFSRLGHHDFWPWSAIRAAERLGEGARDDESSGEAPDLEDLAVSTVLGVDARDYEDRGPYIRVWSHYKPKPIILPQRMVPPIADLRSLVERYAGVEHPLAEALRAAGA